MWTGGTQLEPCPQLLLTASIYMLLPSTCREHACLREQMPLNKPSVGPLGFPYLSPALPGNSLFDPGIP